MGSSLASLGSGGRRGRRRKVFAPMSEINVTPFVDVMLVLLIIFMVAAPLLTVGVPIELPRNPGEAAAGRQRAADRLGQAGRSAYFFRIPRSGSTR